VELFEEIRREYEFGIGTIAGVAKKLRVHRRMVREAIGSALPIQRKKTERPRWKLAGAVAFVDGILEFDRKAPRKQRHTAHRIWERMRAEMQECSVCERTVRQYVQERKRALGLAVNEVFVPQSYDWGVEAEKRLLRGVQESAVKRCSTGHTPHGEYLQFRPFSGQIGDGFVPINVRLFLWGISQTPL
jgi:hypothetical protein